MRTLAVGRQKSWSDPEEKSVGGSRGRRRWDGTRRLDDRRTRPSEESMKRQAGRAGENMIDSGRRRDIRDSMGGKQMNRTVIRTSSTKQDAKGPEESDCRHVIDRGFFHARHGCLSERIMADLDGRRRFGKHAWRWESNASVARKTHADSRRPGHFPACY
jgi:hypothetical protein